MDVGSDDEVVSNMQENKYGTQESEGGFVTVSSEEVDQRQLESNLHETEYEQDAPLDEVIAHTLDQVEINAKSKPI